MRVTWRLLTAVLLGALLLSMASVPAGAARAYGPPWGRFHAGFASRPRSSGDLAKEFSYFGVKDAYAYADSGAKKPFDASTVLAAPTFEVVAIDFGLKAEALSALATARPRYAHPKKVTVGGAKGFESLTEVNGAPIKTKKGAKPRSRVDRLGFLMVARGSTVFEVIADAANGSAVGRFLGSFSPVR